MVRVLGVDLPKKKRLIIALTSIYGIGSSRASLVISNLKMDPDILSDRLSEADAAKLGSYIQKNYCVGGDLSREISGNVKRLISIGCYRGSRHKLGLPVRGQRTRTNARTRKGKKRMIIKKK